MFQPFTYSRTKLLLDDFARVLAIADQVVMTEIMGSREINDDYNIYTADLAAKIPGSVWFEGFEGVVDYACTHAGEKDLIITLGGDGTLLQMARYTVPAGVPAFGINFGKLGILAEIDLPGMRKAISKLAQGNYTIERRKMLQATVFKDGNVLSTAHALNDFVLAKGMFSKLAHLRMFINGKPSGRYAADGLIISTATGSTAYSLSAGGPLVMPELDVSVITPVCAHSLTARALVIPLSDCIELTAVPGSEEMMLSCDGENVIEVQDDTFVRIEKSPYTMKLIRLTSRDYYQTWQQKLMRNVYS